MADWDLCETSPAGHVFSQNTRRRRVICWKHVPRAMCSTEPNQHWWNPIMPPIMDICSQNRSHFTIPHIVYVTTSIWNVSCSHGFLWLDIIFAWRHSMGNKIFHDVCVDEDFPRQCDVRGLCSRTHPVKSTHPCNSSPIKSIGEWHKIVSIISNQKFKSPIVHSVRVTYARLFMFAFGSHLATVCRVHMQIFFVQLQSIVQLTVST